MKTLGEEATEDLEVVDMEDLEEVDMVDLEVVDMVDLAVVDMEDSEDGVVEDKEATGIKGTAMVLIYALEPGRDLQEVVEDFTHNKYLAHNLPYITTTAAFIIR